MQLPDLAIPSAAGVTRHYNYGEIRHVHVIILISIVAITWSSLNWSPPKAATHDFIPPMPNIMITIATTVKAL